MHACHYGKENLTGYGDYLSMACISNSCEKARWEIHREQLKLARADKTLQFGRLSSTKIGSYIVLKYHKVTHKTVA